MITVISKLWKVGRNIVKQNKNTMEEDKYGMDPKGLNSSQNSKFFGEKNIWVNIFWFEKVIG